MKIGASTPYLATDEPTMEQKQKLVLELSRFLNDEGALEICTISEPCSVVIMTNEGQYRKKPLVGGERLFPIGAKLGKKGGVIIVFSCEETIGKYVRPMIEMPILEALERVDGFKGILLRWELTYMGEDDLDMKRAALEARELEEQAHQAALAAVRKEDARYGSW